MTKPKKPRRVTVEQLAITVPTYRRLRNADPPFRNVADIIIAAKAGTLHAALGLSPRHWQGRRRIDAELSEAIREACGVELTQ